VIADIAVIGKTTETPEHGEKQDLPRIGADDRGLGRIAVIG